MALVGLSFGQPGLLTTNHGGDGTDGPFSPTANWTLDTDAQAVYNYTTVNIAAGVTVSVIGSNPIVIKSQGAVIIDGTIDCSGQVGGGSNNGTLGGAGGAAGPGGFAGGAGAGGIVCAGTNGQGPGGGIGGTDSMCLVGGGSFTDPVGGGGGGGNGTAGSPGGAPNAGTLPNVSGAGGAAQGCCPALPGSGGGGGGNDIDALTGAGNDGGAGGGGGGGKCTILSDGGVNISTTGVVRADGGAGGTSAGNGGGGGGGSGGSIMIAAPNILIDGLVSALGGAAGAATQGNCGCSPGGAGGDGCIELCGNLGGVGGTLPPAAVGGESVVLTPECPIACLWVNGNPGEAYGAALSLTCGPPLPTPFGPIVLNFADPMFQLTFPVNGLAPTVSGLSGVVGPNAKIGINLTNIIQPGTCVDIKIQAFTAGAAGLSGVSPPIRIALRF
ncbi:MAG: hypothetical protein CMJ83_14625 [Planctomycetes bacterium]|nr:hypothetical protein [Planctomycetota bacterium]